MRKPIALYVFLTCLVVGNTGRAQDGSYYVKMALNSGTELVAYPVSDTLVAVKFWDSLGSGIPGGFLASVSVLDTSFQSWDYDSVFWVFRLYAGKFYADAAAAMDTAAAVQMANPILQ